MAATPVHQNFSTVAPPPPDLASLKREAAQVGPGLFGVRREASDAERLDLARRFAAVGEAAPVYILSRSEWTDRRAKLFAAGLYEDKGLVVTPDHLAALVGGFDAPVPVLVEHSDSPLGLGYVTAVEHQGEELFGVVTLSAEADALLRACGASSLSVGLAPDLSRLVEVSLVRHPRVADARLFACDPLTGGPRYEGSLDEEGATGVSSVEGTPVPPTLSESVSLPQRRDADATPPSPDPDLDRLLSKGQLLPCQIEAARKLLETGRAQFDTNAGSIRRLLIDLLEARPPSLLFSELAPVAPPGQAATDEAAAALLVPEEAAFYRRHFPGLALGEILKRR